MAVFRHSRRNSCSLIGGPLRVFGHSFAGRLDANAPGFGLAILPSLSLKRFSLSSASSSLATFLTLSTWLVLF